MPEHLLTREGSKTKDDWILKWDDQTISLQMPGGETAMTADLAAVHQIFDYHQLFASKLVSFQTPEGTLSFKGKSQAIGEIQQLVETSLCDDSPYRAELKRHARKLVVRGLLMFVIGGSLFGGYCWWAKVTPEPGQWIHWVGWFIHILLLILLAMALGGPLLSFKALGHLARISRLERRMADNSL